MKIRHYTAQEVGNREKRDQSIGEMKEGKDDGQCDEIKGKCINLKIVCLGLPQGLNLNFEN